MFEIVYNLFWVNKKNFNNQNMNSNIGELTEMCNLSYSHFKRPFITQFAIPPKKYN